MLFASRRCRRACQPSSKEFLPSKGTFRPLEPELLDLQAQLALWGIDHEGQVDLALLVGTDFNAGVRGIGPKKALGLVQKHGRIEFMPLEIRDAVGDVNAIRALYLQPQVTDEYALSFAEPDEDGLIWFLCEELQFSRERVTSALTRAFSPPRSF